MAGNIIPAIATTNAIIAGLIVMQAINILSNRINAIRQSALKSIPNQPLAAWHRQKPDTKCSVCRDVYIPFKVDLARCTLGEFILNVVGQWLVQGLTERDGEEGDEGEAAFTIFEAGRVLADPDFDDNHGRTLADLGIERGKMVTVMDEDEKYRPIHFCICEPCVSYHLAPH